MNEQLTVKLFKRISMLKASIYILTIKGLDY